MIYSPEEAERMLCPMAMQRDHARFCSGPACMAWELHYEFDRAATETKKKHLAGTGAPVSPVYSPTGKGFCGMLPRK